MKYFKLFEDFNYSDILYHGTSEFFTNPKKEKYNIGVGGNDQGEGFYMTNNLPTAKMFSFLALQKKYLMDMTIDPLNRIEKANNVILGVILKCKVNASAKILDIDNDMVSEKIGKEILKIGGCRVGVLKILKDSDFKSVSKIVKYLGYRNYEKNKISYIGNTKIKNEEEFVAKYLGYDGVKLIDQRMETWDFWMKEFGKYPNPLPTTVVIYNLSKVKIIDKI